MCVDVDVVDDVDDVKAEQNVAKTSYENGKTAN